MSLISAEALQFTKRDSVETIAKSIDSYEGEIVNLSDRHLAPNIASALNRNEHVRAVILNSARFDHAELRTLLRNSAIHYLDLSGSRVDAEHLRLIAGSKLVALDCTDANIDRGGFAMLANSSLHGLCIARAGRDSNRLFPVIGQVKHLVVASSLLAEFQSEGQDKRSFDNWRNQQSVKGEMVQITSVGPTQEDVSRARNEFLALAQKNWSVPAHRSSNAANAKFSFFKRGRRLSSASCE